MNKVSDVTLNEANQDMKSVIMTFNVKSDFDYSYLRPQVNEDVVQMRGVLSMGGPMTITDGKMAVFINLKIAMDMTNLKGENMGLTCKITALADGALNLSDSHDATLFCTVKISTLKPTYYISIHETSAGGEYWLNNRKYTKEEWNRLFPGVTPSAFGTATPASLAAVQ